MKKALIIAGAFVAGVAAFAIGFVVLVKVRGGLDPSHTTLAKLPLVGSLVRPEPPAAAQPAGQAGATSAELPGGREVPFLRFGPEARLQRLTQELEAKQKDYETAAHDLERRAHEMEAWERQLTEERDTLRTSLAKEKADAAQLQTDLDRKQSELAGRQLQIEEAEQANLKKTAEIYGKMSPDKSAQILTEMYTKGQQDTVVKIVYLMQDRSAAKTLEAMTDSKIGAQITESLKKVGKNIEKGA